MIKNNSKALMLAAGLLAMAAVAENPPLEGQDVTDWEMHEYFEFY